MAAFQIELEPPVEPAKAFGAPPVLSDLNVKAVSENLTQRYEIKYIVCGRVFRYFPSSILTVINDLDLEIGLIHLRRSHQMTLSGYTVLEMQFPNEDTSAFYDPVERFATREIRPLATCPAKDVGETFERAFAAVAAMVKSAGFW